MIRAVLALAAGAAALLWIVLQAGPAEIARDLQAAGWAVPPMTAIHALQLALSAAAWRLALGSPAIGLPVMLRIRWIREGVNSMLPTAQIGGQVAAIRLLGREGLPASLAAAGTVLDLTLEAISQFLFTLLGLVALAEISAHPLSRGWIAAGVAITGAIAAALVAAQRLGLLRLVERAVARAAAHWPALSSWSLKGLHDRLVHLQSNRGAMLRATSLHTLSWALGSAETWVALAALGHMVTLPQAFVIESLGMAARSAGFAIPAALGVQEGGFLLAAGLFGVPADTALSLSILKRVREVVVGVPALIVWARNEIS